MNYISTSPKTFEIVQVYLLTLYSYWKSQNYFTVDCSCRCCSCRTWGWCLLWLWRLLRPWSLRVWLWPPTCMALNPWSRFLLSMFRLPWQTIRWALCRTPRIRILRLPSLCLWPLPPLCLQTSCSCHCRPWGYWCWSPSRWCHFFCEQKPPRSWQKVSTYFQYCFTTPFVADLVSCQH